ncbi:MAG: ClpXP protease specificity-enhancing factor SspB, partial [Geminicoccaceae bacterium]
IPFEAITVFADPSVEFGLQFNLTERGEEVEDEDDEIEESDDIESEVTSLPQPDVSNEPAVKSTEAVKDGDGAEVVTLDQFRKKS